MSTVPQLKPGEKFHVFQERLARFKAEKEDVYYKVVLDFVNDWLGLEGKFKYRSLSKFKHTEKELYEDPHHNRETLRNHAAIITKELGLKLSLDDETESDDINDYYIIFVLKKCLGKIGYRLKEHSVTFEKKGGELYESTTYSIVLKN